MAGNSCVEQVGRQTLQSCLQGTMQQAAWMRTALGCISGELCAGVGREVGLTCVTRRELV